MVVTAVTDSPSTMSQKSPEKQPSTPAKGKGVKCQVTLLDGESIEITLDKNDIGRALFDKVCLQLDLIERDYFGFTYTDERGPSHVKYWLNLDKKISKQKKRGAWVFEFALKFYPPDPSNLRESLTRWLVVLQVRRDLLSGRLPCTFSTYALLGSYNVQADIGEYDPGEHGQSDDYIRDMAFAPNQTPELREKIASLHKLHKGQTPDEAEKCFLDNAKKLAMYGVDLHKVKDSNNEDLMLGVCASGLLVYKEKLRVNRFVWPQILNLSYKRNSFYIKIRPGELERSEHTIMFKLENHRLAKRLWKTCVEHHTFFRLREAEKPSHNYTFPRFGSKFRYSGRTLYQTRKSAEQLDRPPPFFERAQPARNSLRSQSVDDIGQGRRRPGYGDDSYNSMDRDGGSYNPNDPYNRYADEKDRSDYMNDSLASAKGKPDSGYARDADGNTLDRPGGYNGSDSADKRDRIPGQDDATLERDGRQGAGDDSMGLVSGGIEANGKPETDRERRKREKEEEKRRKEEKKQQDEERKRLEKEAKKKGKGKGGNTSEDIRDQMGQDEATANALGRGPGSVGLDGGPGGRYGPGSRYGDTPDGYRDAQGNLIGHDPGWPYGIGLGVGKGDMTGVVGQEGYVDNKQQFIPPSLPIRETKESLKSGYSDNAMPFFNPAATSTFQRSKVPPPVAPKSNRNQSFDDSFNKSDPPTVATEKVKYNPQHESRPLSSRQVPIVQTQTRTMTFERNGCPSDLEDGLLVSAQAHSTRLQTIETTTYKTERNGVEETRVERKVMMSGDEEDDYDFDSALAEAIRSVTEFNPDMSVERIECVQQIEDVKDTK